MSKEKIQTKSESKQPTGTQYRVGQALRDVLAKENLSDELSFRLTMITNALTKVIVTAIEHSSIGYYDSLELDSRSLAMESRIFHETMELEKNAVDSRVADRRHRKLAQAQQRDE